MKDSERGRIDQFAGPLVGLVALAVYGATLSVGAYPGESARLIAQHTGIVPRFTALFPLWSGIVSIISKLPFGGLALKLNVFSAICGAASIWLLYEIVSRTVFRAVDIRVADVRARFASRLAGTVASLSLAFCVPFWIASDRAHTASFHILLLLTATWFLFKYSSVQDSDESRREHEPYALILAFVYGVGVVEFATFIVFAPLFGLYVAFLLWRSENLRVGIIVKLLLCAILGLSLYAVGAWLFYGTPGYEIRKYHSYFHVIWLVWKEQYFLISRSLPRQGWLIVLVVTVVPWLASLCVARRALNAEKDWGYVFLHVVLSVAAVSVLLNAPFAPWSMLGMETLLVTPSLLIAVLFGYLAAYWYLLPSGLIDTSDSCRLAILVRWLGRILACPALIVCCVAAVRNLPVADGRQAKTVTMFAEQIVDSMGGRSWLVTDGSLDPHIGIAARERGLDIRLINIRLGENDVYKQYLASQFDNVRRKNWTRIGVVPLLRDWLETDVTVVDDVAFSVVPDMWLEMGYYSVPNKTVFWGVKDLRSIDADTLLADHEEVWSTFAVGLKEAGQKGLLDKLLLPHFLARLSHVANDVGVALVDLGHRDGALSAFQSAHKLNEGNTSALLNIVEVAKGDPSVHLPDEIRGNLDNVALSNPPDALSISSMRQYGYVRSWDSSVRLAAEWSARGIKRAAMEILKRAMELAPSAELRRQAEYALVDLYRKVDYDSESEVLCLDLLNRNPRDSKALLNLGRLAIRKGDFERAKKYLRRAEKAGMSLTYVEIERARLHFVVGRLPEARAILKRITSDEPDNISALSLLCMVLLRQKDSGALLACLGYLETLGAGKTVAFMIRGRLAVREGDLLLARSCFEGASANSISHQPAALEELLKLDQKEGRTTDMAFHAEKLLRQRPASVIGNVTRGYVQMRRDEDCLAEDSFLRSLEVKKTARALANLAWLLQKRGAYEEAADSIREAIDMNPLMPQAWDTLGVILMKTSRLVEAEEAFDRSLQLSGENMNVHLHLLALYITKRDELSASKLARKLVRSREQLSKDEQVSLDELLKQL